MIIESAIFQEEYLNALCSNHFIIFRKLLPKIKASKIIPLLNYLDNNYYHWNMETLSRVLLVYEKEDFKDYKLVIKKDGSKFMKDSLQFLFQIPKQQFLPKGLISRIEAEEALVVSFPFIRNESSNNGNVYYPSIIQKINQLAQKRLLEFASINVSKYGKNIMISRKNSIERRMLNENEIVEKLKSYSLQLVLLEELSFIEQVALFAQAEKVIAVHGAGIVNVLYATKLRLLEFYPIERNIRDAFYFAQITGALSLDHQVVEYPSTNKQQDFYSEEKHLEQMKRFLLGDLKRSSP